MSQGVRLRGRMTTFGRDAIVCPIHIEHLVVQLSSVLLNCDVQCLETVNAPNKCVATLDGTDARWRSC